MGDMAHIRPRASFDDAYIDLDTFKERIQEHLRPDRDDLVEADFVHLGLLKNIIDKSLACVAFTTESGIPVPCVTDRTEANKAMLLYLAVQGIAPLEYINEFMDES